MCIGVKVGIFLWISIIENPHTETLHQQKKAELQNMKLNLHMGDTQLCDKHVYFSFSASFHSPTQCLNPDTFTNSIKANRIIQKAIEL